MMKATTELKAIYVLMNGLIEDVQAYEENGCKVGYGGYYDNRVGASKVGITDKIKMIRALLLQVSKDIKGEQ